MKKIIFIRHAKSSWSSGASHDIDRPLNDRGRRDAPFMAEKLKIFCDAIDGSVKSPSKRTLQTSKPFLKTFKIDQSNDLTEKKLYHGSIYDILETVQELPSEWDTAMIFGHNPGMTYIADYFGANDIVNVPTCGILIVKSETDDWAMVNHENSKLLSFEYPKKYIN